jgi:hypothetical protein
MFDGTFGPEPTLGFGRQLAIIARHQVVDPSVPGGRIRPVGGDHESDRNQEHDGQNGQREKQHDIQAPMNVTWLVGSAVTAHTILTNRTNRRRFHVAHICSFAVAARWTTGSRGRRRGMLEAVETSG